MEAIINKMKKLGTGETLSYTESSELFQSMMKGELTESQIGATLTALAIRGETVEELAGALNAVNTHKVLFDKKNKKVLDTCGTGGDGKSTINISTAVSLILASMGLDVVKHGNSSQSGKVGSSDILDSIGIPIGLEKEDAEDYFAENGFVFLFAPKYHPALKYAGKVRKELKFRTIFNFLGPLASPANADYQVIGVSNRSKIELLAEAVLLSKKNNTILYSSLDGYDELSTNAATECFEIKNGKINHYLIDPKNYFTPFKMPEVKDGEDAKEQFMEAIAGKNEQLVTLLAYNASLPLKLIGKAADIAEGFAMAKVHLESGAVMDFINKLSIK